MPRWAMPAARPLVRLCRGPFAFADVLASVAHWSEWGQSFHPSLRHKQLTSPDNERNGQTPIRCPTAMHKLANSNSVLHHSSKATELVATFGRSHEVQQTNAEQPSALA
jgi:hypothetical protein